MVDGMTIGQGVPSTVSISLYNRSMTAELRTMQFLLSRLERISADSVVAHRASGVRGAMLRVVEKIESGRPVRRQEVRRLIESGYLLLQKAAEEKIR
jgi:hypothetical protein